MVSYLKYMKFAVIQSAILFSSIMLLLRLSESQSVTAQQGNMSLVIYDKFTRELGTVQVMPPVSHRWVDVIYESPNTIVL